MGKTEGETTDDADITDRGEHTRPRVRVSVPSPKRTLLLTTEHTKVTKRKFWSADAMGSQFTQIILRRSALICVICGSSFFIRRDLRQVRREQAFLFFPVQRQTRGRNDARGDEHDRDRQFSGSESGGDRRAPQHCVQNLPRGDLSCDVAVRRFRRWSRDFLTGGAKSFDMKLDCVVHFALDFRSRGGRSDTAGNIGRIRGIPGRCFLNND